MTRGPDIALDPTDRQREAAKDLRIAELERELAEARKALRRLQLWCEAVEADADAAREGE